MQTKQLLLGLCLAAGTAFAQAPLPWSTAGNAAASGNFLGTNN
jgi:hypothetical protein